MLFAEYMNIKQEIQTLDIQSTTVFYHVNQLTFSFKNIRYLRL